MARLDKARSSPFRKKEIRESEVKSDGGNEQRFLQEIEKLKQGGANELAQNWLDQYEKASDDELGKLLVSFETFLQKREKALLSLEIPAELDEQLISEINQFDRNVMLSYGNTSLLQGNGGTAEGYEMLGYPHICLKFITNQKLYNENNHMREEFKLLNRVRGLHNGRVRTPIPYFLRIHPTEGHSYGMEMVEGKTLSQILEHPENFRDLVAIAKQLDRKQVLEELSGFVQKMHTERGIIHGDLWKRNIMLDRHGNMFIIDFGKARQHEFDTDIRAQQEAHDMALIQSEPRSFFEEIDKINL